MKRIAITAIAAMTACTLCACGSGLDANASGENGAGQASEEDVKMSLTKECIIANSTLTEEDLASIDFDDFLGYMELFDIDQENPDGEALVRIYESYKKTCSVDHGKDYSYVLDNADGKLTDADIEAIKTLVWQRNNGNLMETMVIDFSEGAVYYAKGDFLSSCTQDKQVCALAPEQVSDVQALLRESGITGWENSYEGTSEGTTGHYAWAVGAEMADGHCVKYSGYGVLDSGTPEELTALLNNLRAEFAE